MEPCGFCGGTGKVPGRSHDNHGAYRPDWPETIRCEYCGGSGQCDDGNKLLPCSTKRAAGAGSPPAGIAPWM